MITIREDKAKAKIKHKQIVQVDYLADQNQVMCVRIEVELWYEKNLEH